MKARSSQLGFITLEFTISLSLALSLIAVLIALTSSLVVVEIGQYIVFSSSREHSVARLTLQDQVAAAQAKYSQLLRSEGLASVFSNEWFEIPATLPASAIRSGYGNNFSTDYPESRLRASMQGVAVDLKFKLLNLDLPLLGALSPESGDEAFTARLVAILRREPSQQECQQFMKDRLQALWEIDNNRFSAFNRGARVATPWEDNGC